MPVAALHSLPAVLGAGRRRRRGGAKRLAVARFGVRASSLDVETATVSVNGEARVVERNKAAREDEEEVTRVAKEEEGERPGLEALYDDGFGTVTVKDYFAAARALSRDDGGPPRWFCPVECGPPAVEDAPLLLFLPGMDGVGTGLILHHKSLGKVFEVRCLHMPVNDRTPFEVHNSKGESWKQLLVGMQGKAAYNRPKVVGPFPGPCASGSYVHRDKYTLRTLSSSSDTRNYRYYDWLLQTIEKCIKHEHDISPNRPIYLLGDSFGGCLALSVAARNPQIDLVLLLVNPATSFAKSPLQPILPLLEAMPSELHFTVPYILSFVMGDPLKMASVSIEKDLSPSESLQKLSDSLTSMLPLLSELADIIPRDTLLWKLKLLKTGAAYTNSRLHAVQAEVLLLASGNDKLLPSGEEADRLFKALKNCRVRYFKDNGHTLLLEDGINLLSVIKGVNMYRRGRQRDFVTDYLPPSLSEFKKTFDEDHKLFHLALGSVMMSTLKKGKIVRGLAGVPDQGPVLFVGYHALMGIELSPLYEEFLRVKKTIVRGMAHPLLFGAKFESSRQELSRFDTVSMYGGLPVTPINMYRLFERNQFVLLYPGGVREALHRKGEEYKLFWPDQPEFVRMAARFGVTIIPFGCVGEDDVLELVLDYNDQKNIPFLREWIESINKETHRLRDSVKGEDGNQDMYLPGLVPKVPGRFYYLFGKPIEMKGMADVVRDRKSANEVYLRIKSEVEDIMSYLKRKREEDPYRSITQRALYQATWGVSAEVPTFEP